MELRKLQEREYHNKVRDLALRNKPDEYEYFWSNQKYYAVAIEHKKVVEDWLKRKITGKSVLDYCCGNGLMSIWMAGNGAVVEGIDISDVSVANASKKAHEEGVSARCKFRVMDAEQMDHPNNSFDVIYERGVLHHLNLKKAYAEIARVMRPDGAAICIEALKHNRIMQWYRRRTPQLRTPWEVDHLLGEEEVRLAREYFCTVEILGFFYLFSLLAVPFRTTRLFNPFLRFLKRIDNIALRLPWLRWQAWHIVFVLSHPKK